MLNRPDHAWSLTNSEAIAKLTSELLREFTRSRDDGRLLALLRGTRADRELAAFLLGLREDPTQLPALAALAFDSSPIVRSGAAEALGLWAVHEVGGNPVHELLNDLLQDPGTRVARGVASGLGGAISRAAIASHEEALLTHVSAQVRRRTRKLIDKLGSAG
jgi:HEAT repeat protein